VRKTWRPGITLSLDFQPKIDTLKAVDSSLVTLAAEVNDTGEQARTYTSAHLQKLNETLQPRAQRSRVVCRRVVATVREKIAAMRQPA
jgi:hypothetical protein